MSFKAIQSSLQVLKQKTFTGETKKAVLTYSEYEQIKDLDLDELPDNIAPTILLVPDQMTEDMWDPSLAK